MKIYTSVTYQMTKDGMEEISSESFDYEGPVAQAGSGGGGQQTVEKHYYYGSDGPGSSPDPQDAVGITGLAGSPTLTPATTTASTSPTNYAAGTNSVAATNAPSTLPNAITPTINYANPYDMMNNMQSPQGIASLNPTNKPTV